MNVFENLYRNATEHNNAPVTIRVGVLETATTLGVGESLAGFFVEDDGDGIDPDQRDTVFDQEYTTKPNGTGLGLSIVKGIIEAHNWTVSVTNSAQGGARFEIRTTEISH